VGLLVALCVTFIVLWATDAHLTPEATGAVAGAAVSGLVAIALAVLGFVERRADAQRRQDEREADAHERRQTRNESYMIESFGFFTGGTQRRGVGISAVEGLLPELPDLRGVFVPLLVNQAIYVLTKVPESKKRSDVAAEVTENAAGGKALDDHEKDNFNRMIALLAELRPRDQEHEESYEKLATKIQEKITRVTDETAKWLEHRLSELGPRPTS